MYDDADVETYAARLRSPDADVRELAAEEATDGVSDWGQHSYTTPQAARITGALVDALAVETTATTRESIINALATLVEWDLAPVGEVLRATKVSRPHDDDLADHWRDIEAWAARQV